MLRSGTKPTRLFEHVHEVYDASGRNILKRCGDHVVISLFHRGNGELDGGCAGFSLMGNGILGTDKADFADYPAAGGREPGLAGLCVGGKGSHCGSGGSELGLQVLAADARDHKALDRIDILGDVQLRLVGLALDLDGNRGFARLMQSDIQRCTDLIDSFTWELFITVRAAVEVVNAEHRRLAALGIGDLRIQVDAIDGNFPGCREVLAVPAVQVHRR